MAKIRVNNTKINLNNSGQNFINDTSSNISISNFLPDRTFRERIIRDRTGEFILDNKKYTLETLKLSLEDSKKVQVQRKKLEFNYDKSLIVNHAYYGSIRERLRVAVEQIIDKFPASIYIDPVLSDVALTPTVLNYVYSPSSNEATFNIIKNRVINTFELNLTEGVTIENEVRDLVNNFRNFQINNISQNVKADIIDVTGFGRNESLLSFRVKGNPFPLATNGNNYTIGFHISPNKGLQDMVIKSLGELEQYILSKKINVGYEFLLKLPTEDNRRDSFDERTLFWNTSDGYNIDIDTPSFNNFFSELLLIGNDIDTFKTDILYNRLTPDSIKEYDDTDDLKYRKLMRIYGANIDEYKRLIDNLTFINKYEYDNVESVPTFLVKSVAKTLGWKIFDIVGDNDLMETFFNREDVESNQTPFEIDIELWRRILINTNFFWKGKGTRDVIKTLFFFTGVPNDLIDIDEHVYIVDPLNTSNIQTVNLNLNGRPLSDFIDSQGYPKMSENNNFQWFQQDGNNDFGQKYIGFYRSLGYTPEKVVDNKKSWVKGDTVRLADNTNYTITDSRQVINTKEISLNIDISKAIESDFYQFQKLYNLPIDNVTGYSFGCVDYAPIDANKLSFVEFSRKIEGSYIDVKTRKISSDYYTGSYRSLSNLYELYLQHPNSKKYTFSSLSEYVSKFDEYVDKFLVQVIPATTIFSGTNQVIRNPLFLNQKHTYFSTKDSCDTTFSTNQPLANSSTPKLLEITERIIKPIKNNIKTYTVNGSFNTIEGINVNDSVFRYEPLYNLEDNIYNFSTPNFIVTTGATKIEETTPTVPSHIIYDYTNDPIHEIYVEFTGNTQFLTGDTTFKEIRFDFFSYDNTITGFTPTVLFSKTYSSNLFSTGNTELVIEVEKTLLEPDREYLLKPYFVVEETSISASTITDVQPYNITENFNNNIYPLYLTNNSVILNIAFDRDLYDTYTGLTMDSGYDLSIQSNPYLIYNSFEDNYFISIEQVGDITPLVEFPQILPQQGVLFTQNLPLSFSGQTEFFTLYEPSGDVVLSLNGVILTKGTSTPPYEYYQDTTNPSRLILDDFLVETDKLTATYIINQGSNQTFKTETLMIDSPIVSGTTASPTDKVFFNTGSTKYEIFSEEPILNANELILVINGVTQTFNVDFNIFPNNNKRIIIEGLQLQEGDTITLHYVLQEQFEEEIIYNNPVIEVEFTSFTTNDNGTFILEIYDRSDDTFSNMLFSGTTSFIENGANFSITSPDLSSVAYTDLMFRIRSDKEFETLLGVNLILTKYSEVINFRVEI